MNVIAVFDLLINRFLGSILFIQQGFTFFLKMKDFGVIQDHTMKMLIDACEKQEAIFFRGMTIVLKIERKKK